MKKVVFTLALCVVASISFGQKKTVSTVKSELKGSNPNMELARSLIKEALANPETANEAETWFVAGQVENKQFDTERIKEIMNLNNMGPNEDIMYPALDNIYPYFEKADELEQIPDEKGKVKLKFRKDIKAIMLANRPYYINAGSYFYDKGNYEKAYKNFRFYGDMPNLPIFEGDQSKFEVMAKDTNAIKIRYYAGLAASQVPDHDAAIALFNEIKDMGFNEIDIYKQLASEYHQKKDTVGFSGILEKGIAKFPKESYFLLNMINININQGKTKEAIVNLKQAIETSPNDAQLYDVLGLVYENTKEIEEAITCIKKALEIDPNYAEALSHMGRLYYNLGIEARGAADMGGKASKSYDQDIKKVEEFFKGAIPYFEKAYKLNPQDSDAVFALRNIYYSLKMNDEYEKWDKIYLEQ
jgi:tetratricopeptide (TPR) repeat protein